MRLKIAVCTLLFTLLGLGFLPPLYAQTRRLTGHVTSEDDKTPLQGVTIAIKGKNEVKLTNALGDFTIDAKPEDVLLITYTGYAPQEIKVGSRPVMNVSMKVGTQKMDEVVVVGYGTQSRRTLTGAVSTVDPQVLKSAPSTNLGNALQGTVTGVIVQQSTGQPGSTPVITFRGGSNFDGSGSPLFILDGVIVPSLYGINGDDVESMTVLKDAASTAIYGARASNGVVLVTTKKGKKGHTQVTYSYRDATNFIRYDPLHYMNGAQYLHMQRIGIGNRYDADAADNNGLGNASAMNTDKSELTGAWGWANSSGWTSPIGLYTTQEVSNSNRQYLSNPNWHLLVDPNPFNSNESDSLLYTSYSQRQLENMIMQKGKTQQHFVGFSGANDMGSFALGIGVVNDQGMIIGSSFKRMDVNFNGGLNVSKDIKVTLTANAYSTNTNPSYYTADGGAASSPAGLSGGTGGLIQRFIGVAPTVRFTNDTSGAQIPGPNDPTLGNPAIWKNIYYNNTVEQRFSGSLGLEYDITNDLKIVASGSGFYRYNNANSFTKAYQAGSGGTEITTRPASFSIINDAQYSYNAFLEYSKSFGKNKISAMGGGEFYSFTEHTFSGAATGASTDDVPWLVASTTATGVPSSDFPIWDELASAIGRVNYSYEDKYLLTANVRYDGTSRLIQNRYGAFPGVSAGWNMQKEPFFQRSSLSKYVSTLKPRLSYGENGSIAAFNYIGGSNNLFSYYPAYQVYSNNGIYNGNSGYITNTLANQDLKWETAATFDYGVDLGLFNDRLVFMADGFVRNIYNKLTSLPVPASTGFTSFYTNVGELRDKGFELEVKAKIIRPVKADGLSWDLSANVYTVKNYVVKLPNNGLPGNREGTSEVWNPNGNGQLLQVQGLAQGQRVGEDAVYAPKWDGIYKTATELSADANVYNSFTPYVNKTTKLMGDARWHQAYHNDTIDSRQFVYVGRTIPSVTGGFSSSVNYKGFSLYGQFDYALGFVILDEEKLRGLNDVQGSANGTTDVLNTWSPSNPNGTLPRYYWANQGRNYATDASGDNPPANLWEKGDYLAVRELTLSYEVSRRLLGQAFRDRVHGLRLYVSGNNLAYFTRYSNNSPEVGGYDNGRFPLPRTLTLGLNLSL
jgi:TonB-linked SusC/RagA family outer membrane protein